MPPVRAYEYVLPDATLCWWEYGREDALLVDAAISKNGRTLAVLDGEKIWVYDTEDGEQKAVIDVGTDGMASISVSDTGEYIIAAFDDLHVCVYDLRGNEEKRWFAIAAEDIYGCEFAGVAMGEHLKKCLRQNGAKIE